MLCMSQFLFQHLSAGPSSKISVGTEKSLGKGTKNQRTQKNYRKQREGVYYVFESLTLPKGRFIYLCLSHSCQLFVQPVLKKMTVAIASLPQAIFSGNWTVFPGSLCLPFVAAVLWKCHSHADFLWLVIIKLHEIRHCMCCCLSGCSMGKGRSRQMLEQGGMICVSWPRVGVGCVQACRDLYMYVT